MKDDYLGEPTSFLDHVCLSCSQRQCETSKHIVEIDNMFESRISAEAIEKHLCSSKPDQKIPHGPMIWMVMQRNVWSDIAGWRKKPQQLYKVTTPCLDDHQFREEELGSVGEMTKVCSQIVLICLYLARIGRPDILWLVNKLARAVTKWTRACDKRLARLISYIHHTSDFWQIVMWETLPNNADWDCFKTPILQEILKTQNRP